LVARSDGKPGTLREFFTGVGLLGQGLRVWLTAPRLMLLGVVPALIVGALFLVGIIALGLNLDGIATAVTPFADAWGEPLRTGIRVIAGLAFLAVAVLVVIYTFTTVTLIVGDPFYEKIWRHVESRFGAVPQAPPRGFWRGVGRDVGTGLRMLIPTIFAGLALFVLGFIPLVGTILAATLGAFVGGWFLAVELAGLGFDARGLSLRERRQTLCARRAMTLGFGVATYLLFLLPLGAVLVMPAAVAGATLLTRRALGESTDPSASRLSAPAAPQSASTGD
jgi:CysZ protein